MKRLFIPFLLSLSLNIAQAQTYLISTGGTVTSCAGDFYDSGGAGGNYGANQNFVMTFHSNNAVNTHIKMSFNLFDVEPGDTLIVYDGSTTGASIIGKYNNNNLPPSFVRASINNTSGDLTFRFRSNANLNYAGWFASLVCTPQCQEIIAMFHPTLTIPNPNDSNYVDICLGSPITFGARGSGAAFPQNGIIYSQDSTNCTYLWDFGDGTTATGQIVNHTYTVVRGYDIALTITDSRGCTNSNYLGGRVRISKNPIAAVHPIPDICSGSDTSYITVGYNSNSIVMVEPITSVQSASERFDSTMFIPDGPNCAVQCYNTFVTFTSFIPGSTITSASDILSICVNMEHSYAGDLGFRIICPNNQSVVLDPNTHSGGAYMGVPFGGANHASYDNGCDPINNPSGSGWTYCWSQIYPQQGTLDALSNGGGTIDSTNTITNTNYVTPNNSLSGLVGCPLNGTWNIEICDDFAIDNGYIFWWELNLDPSLLPVGWSYQVPIDTVIWSGSFLNIVNDTTVMVIPTTGGNYPYTVTLIDAFGCSYDTTLSIEVVQTPDVNLGNDTTLCGNNINFTLDAGPGSVYDWSTGATIQTQPVTSTGIYGVDVFNYNANHTLTCWDGDTIFIKVLNLPHVNLGPDVCVTDPIVLDAGYPGYEYLWSNGQTTQTQGVNVSGLYAVTVSEEFGWGCDDVDTILVSLNPIPRLELGADTSMCSHNSIKLWAKDVDGYLDNGNYVYSYYWPGTGETTRGIKVSCLPVGENEIKLVVTGCTVVDTVRKVEAHLCELEMPNVITPNGDDKNERFEVKGIDAYPNSKVQIYNRWGKKVFESKNYNEDSYWDGGNEAEGVYYYVLTVNYGEDTGCVEARNFNGTITIIR